MKKKSIIILAVVIIGLATVISILLGSLDFSSTSLSKTLKSSVYDNYETLKNEFSDMSNTDEVIDYLYDWASTQGYSATKTGSSLEITKTAGDDYIDAPSTTIHTDLNLSEVSDMAQNIAVAQNTLIGSEDYGKVVLLFTPVSGYDHYGADSISAKDLDTDYLITLENNTSSGLTINTSSASIITINSDLKMTDSTYTIAYELTLSGLDLTNYDASYTSYDNPILMFTDFMSSLNNQSLYFEFTNLSGGTTNTNFPSSVTVTLLFDKRTDEKFISKLESFEESLEKEYKEDFPNYKFEANQVTVPDQVIEKNDGLKLLSFFYTMPESTSQTTDDNDKSTVVARTSINTVSTTGSFTATMYNFALNDLAATESLDDLSQTADVTGCNMTIKSLADSWGISTDSSFLYSSLSESLTEAGISDSSTITEFLPSSNGSFANTNDDLEQIILNINNTESFEQTISLIDFLENLKNEID